MGNKVPITAFTGMPPDSALLSILPPRQAQPGSLEFIKAQRLLHSATLLKSVEEIHKDVSHNGCRKLQATLKAHNANTHVQDVNFEVGDYVLVAQRLSSIGHKLRVKRRGPNVWLVLFQIWYLSLKTFYRIHQL